MWEIWANLLFPKALKSCPKSNKLPDLVTLDDSNKMLRGVLQEILFLEIPIIILFE